MAGMYRTVDGRGPFAAGEGASGNAWTFGIEAYDGSALHADDVYAREGRAHEHEGIGEARPSHVDVAVIHDELQSFTHVRAVAAGGRFHVGDVVFPATGWYDVHYAFTPRFSTRLLALVLLLVHGSSVARVAPSGPGVASVGGEAIAGSGIDNNGDPAHVLYPHDLARLGIDVNASADTAVTTRTLTELLGADVNAGAARALWQRYHASHLTSGVTGRVYVGARFTKTGGDSADATGDDGTTTADAYQLATGTTVHYAPAAGLERYTVPSAAHRAWMRVCDASGGVCEGSADNSVAVPPGKSSDRDGRQQADARREHYAVEVAVHRVRLPEACAGGSPVVDVATITLQRRVNGRYVINRIAPLSGDEVPLSEGGSTPAPAAAVAYGKVAVGTGGAGRGVGMTMPQWRTLHAHPADVNPEAITCEDARWYAGAAPAPASASTSNTAGDGAVTSFGYPSLMLVHNTSAAGGALSALVMRIRAAETREVLTLMVPTTAGSTATRKPGAPHVVVVPSEEKGRTDPEGNGGDAAVPVPPVFAPVPSCCDAGWISIGGGTCVKVSAAVGPAGDAGVCGSERPHPAVPAGFVGMRYALAEAVVASQRARGVVEPLGVAFGAAPSTTEDAYTTLIRADATAAAAAGLQSEPIDPLTPGAPPTIHVLRTARGAAGNCTRIAPDYAGYPVAVGCATPLRHLCMRRCALPTPAPGDGASVAGGASQPKPKPPAPVDDGGSGGSGNVVLAVMLVACILVVVVLLYVALKRRCAKRRGVDEDSAEGGGAHQKPAHHHHHHCGKHTDNGFTIPDEPMQHEYSDEDCDAEMEGVQEQMGQALQALPQGGAGAGTQEAAPRPQYAANVVTPP